MAQINLYIRGSDEAVFERLKTLLDKEGRSLSDFVAEAARRFVDAKDSAGPEDIELDGAGGKKVFRGWTLHWETKKSNQIGVFLTEKGKLAVWDYDPTKAGPWRPIFEVFDNLNKMWSRRKSHDFRRIQRIVEQKHAAITGKLKVQRLDI